MWKDYQSLWKWFFFGNFYTKDLFSRKKQILDDFSSILSYLIVLELLFLLQFMCP